MNKKYTVKLPTEDRHTLLTLVGRGRVAMRKVKRAWILLQADAGTDGPAWSDEQIQQAYDVGLRTIYRVRQTWVEQGLQAVLSQAPQTRHRARKLDGEHEAHLIALAYACIVAAQCSCSSVEPRDRACVSNPPIRWKLDRSLSPANIQTALIARVVF